MNPDRIARFALMAAFAACAAFAPAQEAKPAEAKPAVPVQKPVEVKKEEKKPEAPKEKNIDDTVKEFTKSDGLFPIYRKKTSSQDTIYMEIPEAMLGKLMLLQATAGSGLANTSSGVYHGQPINDIAFKLEKTDDGKLNMIAPDLSQRTTNPQMMKVMERSFPSGILSTFDIKAKQEDRKSVLIEIGSLFKSDVAEVSSALSGGMMAMLFGGSGGYGIDGSRTMIGSVKNLPENLYVRTDMVLTRRSALDGPKAVPFSVAYNLSVLPESNGYMPRLGDPRVGYFTTSFQNLDDPASRDTMVNYIERWNLKKKDPKAAMSEPVKPIVFWIDNGVPKQYRESVREGLLMYNPAFEKIGIKDAVVVKQMPDDADWDIADLRYNVIRWTTGMPFAIALFRANPVTGEILNACINMDGGFASGGTFVSEGVVDPTGFFPKRTLPGAEKPKAATSENNDPRLCAGLAEKTIRMQYAQVAFDVAGAPGLGLTKEDISKQYIREVVAHEFGHCLGLRHNFAASNQLSMSELSNKAVTEKYGTGASVMDYNDWNIGALKNKGVPVYAQKIGTYDEWAIGYGYTPTPAVTPQGELPVLKKIASKGSLPGYRYQSDATVNDLDPTVETFDLAKEPMDFFERNLQVSRWLLFNLDKEYPKSGQSYYDLSWRWTAALRNYYSSAGSISYYLGGVSLSNAYKGDPQGKLPITPIEGARQQKALDLLNGYVFAPNAFTFPKEDLAKLTFYPNAPDNEADSSQREFPMRRSFESFQRAALQTVFDPTVLQRIAENEFRSDGKSLSMAQMFKSTDANIWKELLTGQEISELRRALQRDELTVLIQLALGRVAGAPADAKTLAFARLQSLKTRLKAAIPTAKGEYGQPHLQESLAKIERALNAETVVAQ
ncbi:zinc-dependent metalloprotease [soil metagenome]